MGHELKLYGEEARSIKKYRLGWLAALLACLTLVSSCAVMYLRPKTREEPVCIENLVVDVSVLPEGWALGFGPTHPPQGKRLKDELEGVFVQFDRGSAAPVALHMVLKYRNDLQAAVSFCTTDEFEERDSTLGSWAEPNEWLYRSTVADRFRFACAETEIWQRAVICTAVAQYDEYVSVFRTPVSPYYMTLGDLERILEAIDERMRLRLTESDG
jgi:hypothetical protein